MQQIRFAGANGGFEVGIGGFGDCRAGVCRMPAMGGLSAGDGLWFAGALQGA
jgi:hypothetical protein